MEKKQVFLQSFNVPKCIAIGLSIVEGLFSLLFYCESGINEYAVKKNLADVFGASLLLLELGCLRYVVLLYHLGMLCVFMRKSKSFVYGAECEIYLSCYNLFLQFLYYIRRNKQLRENVESMLFCCALERSNSPYIESILQPCISKDLKGVFTMWV